MAKDDFGKDRDRDEQEKMVDRLLKKLPYADPTLRGSEPQVRKPSPRPRPGAPPGPAGGPTMAARRPTAAPSSVAVWGKVTLAVVAALAVTQWPYSHACGFPLALYLLGVVVVLVAGVWGGIAAWKARIGAAHLVALAVVAFGAALVMGQTLPRVGYARVEASWRCGVGGEGSTAPPPTQTAPPGGAAELAQPGAQDVEPAAQRATPTPPEETIDPRTRPTARPTTPPAEPNPR